MNIRKFDINKDYTVIANWWFEQKWPIIDKLHLPKTGYIIDNYCAGFLYKTDSAFGILEFIISNPKTNREERAKALDLLLDTIIKDAKESNIKSLFSSLEHPKLIERYKNHGFKITDNNMTNMVMRLE